MVDRQKASPLQARIGNSIGPTRELMVTQLSCLIRMCRSPWPCVMRGPITRQRICITARTYPHHLFAPMIGRASRPSESDSHFISMNLSAVYEETSNSALSLISLDELPTRILNCPGSTTHC